MRTLRDTMEYVEPEGDDHGVSSASWGLFGVVWPAGEALAHLMVEYDVAGRRVLEVGCGIAVASLVLQRRNADITATDQHPYAERFLAVNVALNDVAAIPFIRAGWGEDADLGRFDLIIGSDLLYEPDHVELLSEFISRHGEPTCEVLIVDAGRGHGPAFTREMTKHGFDAMDYEPPVHPEFDPPFRPQYLRYLRHGKN